jgi:hypothetical protein
MKQESYELFKNADIYKITQVIDAELKTRNEQAFWGEKVVPFTEAILSVLIPLRESNSLFTPEGIKVDELTPDYGRCVIGVAGPVRDDRNHPRELQS